MYILRTLRMEYWFLFFTSRFIFHFRFLFPSFYTQYKYIIKSYFLYVYFVCHSFYLFDLVGGVRIRAGGNKITFYSFRNEEPRPYPRRNPKGKPMRQLSSVQRHLINASQPASCFDISRDSQLAAIASGRSIQIWQINVPQMTQSFEEHTGAVTCVSFSPNCEFFASGSEDKTVIVWNLGFSLVVTTFKVNHF